MLLQMFVVDMRIKCKMKLPNASEEKRVPSAKQLHSLAEILLNHEAITLMNHVESLHLE